MSDLNDIKQRCDELVWMIKHSTEPYGKIECIIKQSLIQINQEKVRDCAYILSNLDGLMSTFIIWSETNKRFQPEDKYDVFWILSVALSQSKNMLDFCFANEHLEQHLKHSDAHIRILAAKGLDELHSKCNTLIKQLFAVESFKRVRDAYWSETHENAKIILSECAIHLKEITLKNM